MNKSLQEKSAARLAAAQLLYRTYISGEALVAERLIADYKDYQQGEEKTPVTPNATLLRNLLSGMAEHGDALEPWVDKSLTGEWKKARMSPLLLAILRLGLFELAHYRDTNAPIIINEYATLTGRFFSDAETGFINAALNAAAKEMRG